MIVVHVLGSSRLPARWTSPLQLTRHFSSNSLSSMTSPMSGGSPTNLPFPVSPLARVQQQVLQGSQDPVTEPFADRSVTHRARLNSVSPLVPPRSLEVTPSGTTPRVRSSIPISPASMHREQQQQQQRPRRMSLGSHSSGSGTLLDTDTRAQNAGHSRRMSDGGVVFMPTAALDRMSPLQRVREELRHNDEPVTLPASVINSYRRQVRWGVVTAGVVPRAWCLALCFSALWCSLYHRSVRAGYQCPL
jgi:hypothetical protein